MKANNLMIGDYCKCGDTLVRITRISETSASGLDLEALEPIPLTEDILKSNDFEQYGHHSMLYVNKNTPDEVSIHIDYKESVDIDAPSYKYSGWCENVHELQHALRLCGLSDLADNFVLP